MIYLIIGLGNGEAIVVNVWTTVTKSDETWTTVSKSTEVWTTVSKTSEVWTAV